MTRRERERKSSFLVNLIGELKPKKTGHEDKKTFKIYICGHPDIKKVKYSCDTQREGEKEHFSSEFDWGTRAQKNWT